jgi:hypothetical protein
LSEEELPNLMRTLLAAGFEVTRVDRKPNYLALALVRPNAFGSRIRYLVAYAGDRLISEADIDGLEKLSQREASSLVVVSRNTNVTRNSIVVLTKSKLFSLMGGVVSSVHIHSSCSALLAVTVAFIRAGDTTTLDSSA